MNIILRKKLLSIKTVALFIAASMIVSLAACSAFTMSVKADDLMKGVTPASVAGKETDDNFKKAFTDFSIKLFKESVDKDKNSLISPLSVYLALAMTTNGADGNTLTEMQTVLGGDIKISELNEYLYSYVAGLKNTEKEKLSIANSIWFSDDDSFMVEKDFLQKNADFYNAAAYKSDFNSNQTVKDINNWVNKNTDGMIKDILQNIDSDTVMFLINAIAFDAEWGTVYEKEQIKEGIFNSINGEKRTVEFMNSAESRYLQGNNATGFIKPYSDRYSFVALLPNEGTDINTFVSSLTADSFSTLLKPKSDYSVIASLPKFKYDYEIKMNDALEKIGMPEAFTGNANFKKLGSSDDGNLYISEVLHKTYIEVNEKGTKAGAATKVEISKNSACIDEKKQVTVVLDRPFVYAIVDSKTGLPIFLGTVTDINK